MANALLTTSPQTLTTVANRYYTVQNKGSTDMYLEEASAAPDNTNNAFVVKPGGAVRARRGSSTELYVWNGSGSRDDRVVYDEDN